ncbi:hypothetical protein [Sphaerisporangium rufum]|uniref:hypothetical protein n=1 Tax=Sphaerisporangium rufum TaxID=1381558 RepID=UPI001951C947|nr:hypothetical protein [Sphaerisporangium rufum]
MNAMYTLSPAPSITGAALAGSAAVLFPPLAPAALLLGACVSHPGQIWAAGAALGDARDLVRDAREKMTEAVRRHADGWHEAARDAFVDTRLRPYQAVLDEAAEMFDKMQAVTSRLSLGYAVGGLSSVPLGALCLSAAAKWSVPGGQGVALTDTALALARVRGLVTKLNQLVKFVAELLNKLVLRLVQLMNWILKLIRAGKAPLASPEVVAWVARPAGYAGIGAWPLMLNKGPSALTGAVPDLDPPHEVPKGSAVPPGHRAPTAAQRRALVDVRPAALKALAADLDDVVTGPLSRAQELCAGNKVGTPGFGAIGLLGLHQGFHQMCDQAAGQLGECRDTAGSWLPALRTAGGNWLAVEEEVTEDIRRRGR